MRVLFVLLLATAPTAAEDRWYLTTVNRSPSCAEEANKRTEPCRNTPKVVCYAPNAPMMGYCPDKLPRIAATVLCSLPTTVHDLWIPGTPRPESAPKNPAVLCKVSAADHTALVADTDLTPMPVASDSKTPVKDLPQKEKTAADAVLTKVGIPNKAAILNDPKVTTEDLVRTVGKKLDPVFDPTQFDPATKGVK